MKRASDPGGGDDSDTSAEQHEERSEPFHGLKLARATDVVTLSRGDTSITSNEYGHENFVFRFRPRLRRFRGRRAELSDSSA